MVSPLVQFRRFRICLSSAVVTTKSVITLFVLQILFHIIGSANTLAASPLTKTTFPKTTSAKTARSSATIIRTFLSRVPVENTSLWQDTGDTARVNALLAGSSQYVNRPGTEPADMKYALTYAKHALDLSLKLHYSAGEGRSYILLSQVYREKEETTTGITFADKAVALFSRSPQPAGAAEAYFERATYDDMNSEVSLRTKINRYSKGLKFLESSQPSPLKLADALKFMGDLYQYHKEYPTALLYLKRALAIYQKIQHRDLQETYSLIGNVLIQTGRFQEGIRYNLMAASTIEKNRDSSMTACEIYNNLGIAHDFIQNRNKAAFYFEKAKTFAVRNGNIDAAQFISCNLAQAYSGLKQYAKALKTLNAAFALNPSVNNAIGTVIQGQYLLAYSGLKKYQQAQPYYERVAVKLREKPLAQDWSFGAYLDAMKYLLDVKKYRELNELRAAVSISPDYHPASVPRLTYEQLTFQADSARGDYSSAFRHSQQYLNLTIANLKKGYNQRIADLQVQYETKNKDREINSKARNISLLTRQNLLQQSVLSDQRLIRNLSVGSAALLALLLGLGFNRYTSKQKANQVLQKQQDAINSQNEALKQLVTEREWLLKEIHHRVKNSLQIVISLLNAQFYNVKDGVAKEVIRESQHRIHSVSLIHQKLYQYDDLSGINMRDYIGDLSVYIQDSFKTYNKIRFSFDIEPITIDVSQAVPLGLILNETITNAIKHAFPEHTTTKGQISITLRSSNGMIELKVTDNGKGLPPDADLSAGNSLGIKLVNGLTRQLKGSVDISSNQGVSVAVRFTASPLVHS